MVAEAGGSLSDRYIFPPFSVLDRRQGAWQERRRMWLACGMQSEIGRSANTFNIGDHAIAAVDTDQSVFDPVLSELAYAWFCPPAGRVLDPFAGGSVRGIIAAQRGYHYTGVDLSARQVEANEAQRDLITGAGSATWAVGDSTRIASLPATDQGGFDALFTCPPYYDLEVYSSDPSDLSHAPTYADFLMMYRAAVTASISLLVRPSFASIVIGDIRDRRGCYRGLVADTIQAFADAGAALYNEAVIIDPVGTAAVRAEGQFKKNRKLVRVHQTMLVFAVGNPLAAAARCAGHVVDAALSDSDDQLSLLVDGAGPTVSLELSA